MNETFFLFCHFKKEATLKFIKYVTFLKPKAEENSLGRTARVLQSFSLIILTMQFLYFQLRLIFKIYFKIYLMFILSIHVLLPLITSIPNLLGYPFR